MSKEVYYRQCVLTRKEGDAEHHLTTWIPEKGVEVGCTLRIKEHGAKEYEPDRWTVVSVGRTRQDEKRVKERAHNWTKYRQATDV